jgi:hypothetical protein
MMRTARLLRHLRPFTATPNVAAITSSATATAAPVTSPVRVITHTTTRAVAATPAASSSAGNAKPGLRVDYRYTT